MKNRLFLILFALVALQGCGIYTTYQQPKLAVTDSLYRQQPDSLIATTKTLADFSWRACFTDPQLQQLIALGLAQNTDLKIARLKVIEAEATLQASRLAFVPSLRAEGQGGIERAGDKGSTKSFSAKLTASWEVDIFGRLRNAKRSERAALEQSQAYVQAVQSALIASIAEGYYTLLMLDEQLRISRTTLDTWKANIRALSALKQAGKTNETALLQAKANRLSVEGSVLTLERRIAEQQNALCNLLGIAPQVIHRSSLSEQHFPTQFSIGLPLELVSRRPDVHQAEMALAKAFYATNAARSAFYPSITLSGIIGWSQSGVSLSNPGTWLLSAVGSLVQPIFTQGLNRARLTIAKAQQEEALLTFRQRLLEAGTEVNNALALWQTALKRLDIDKKQIMHLRAAVWNTQLLMKYGRTNYLEVLTAQQSLLQAELAEASDRYDEIKGIISLYHALGGGAE